MKNGLNGVSFLLYALLGLLAGCAGYNAATTPALRSYDVSTLAGEKGIPGFTNGAGVTATFNFPYGVAVDGSGNVYVGDIGNNAVRLITPAGLVSTLAGSGSPGDNNATGIAASFSHPQGVAVDAAGYVYVADTVNNLIRVIAPGGAVTTLAGGGPGSGVLGGTVNATGTAASFYYPYGIAVDSSGNVYVGEFGNHLIRKITPGGVVSTLAGVSGTLGFNNGPGLTALFHHPQGVGVDGSGNVYVADTGNNVIRKITPGGMVSTYAGIPGDYGYFDSASNNALFNNPDGLAVDGSGNVYVADSFNNRIRKIIPTGWVSTVAGSGQNGANNGPGTLASFNNPYSVAVDRSGNLYVGDSDNHLIRKILNQ